MTSIASQIDISKHEDCNDKTNANLSRKKQYEDLTNTLSIKKKLIKYKKSFMQ